MTNTPGPRAAKMGDNQPPALESVLSDRYADLLKRLKAWRKKAEAANLSPKTVEDVAALNKLYLDGADLLAEAEKARTEEKEEFLAKGRAVDKFFNSGMRDVFQPLANTLKKTAAERQLEITREEQRKADAEAERLRKKAQEDQEKAQRAESRGAVTQADVFQDRAAATMDAAAEASARANQDIREASRVAVGGVKSSVGEKTVVTGINKAELDIAALLPFLKEKDLIEAAQRAVNMGNTIKGVVTRVEAISNVRR